MTKMADDMFKGFGGGLMNMRDPFKDDPFFNGKGGFGDMMGGFGNIDKMMKDMQGRMLEMPSGGKGNGHFQM